MSRKKLVVIASIVVGGVVAVVLSVGGRDGTRHHRRVDTKEVHARAIDQTDVGVSMSALMNAPEGATPCETAYLAIDAEQQAAKLRGSKSIFQWVAPKAEFLAQCQTLPAAAQSCLAPRYRRAHDAECLQARPPTDALEKLLVGAPVQEPTYGL